MDCVGVEPTTSSHAFFNADLSSYLKKGAAPAERENALFRSHPVYFARGCIVFGGEYNRRRLP
jgi:hypothetical protein